MILDGKELSKKRKEIIKVMVSMFGRETPVDVDFSQIERVD